MERQLAEQQAQNQILQERLERAVEIARDKQDEFACGNNCPRKMIRREIVPVAARTSEREQRTWARWETNHESNESHE
jgi:hypothetical protein